MRLPVLKTYKMYINGAFPRTESGRYFELSNKKGDLIANICRGSRKDIRNAVEAARKAQSGWAGKTAYLRGQILYRIAEMLEGRKSQFISELEELGFSGKKAQKEVENSIDQLIYYAGWSDKYQQILSTVNPVSGSYFNFSKPEPTGVVAIIADLESPLLGLVTQIATTIISGNSVVIVASEKYPTLSISFAEVLATSDVPNGVVNIITGLEDELYPILSTHMDVNAIWIATKVEDKIKIVEEDSSLNVKRVCKQSFSDWSSDNAKSPYLIQEFLETKTTWHPIGY